MLLVLMCAGWQEYISPALNNARSTRMFKLKAPLPPPSFSHITGGNCVVVSGEVIRRPVQKDQRLVQCFEQSL